jgi:hypothetical protein
VTDRALLHMMFAAIGWALVLSTLAWAGDTILPLPPADQKILVEQLGADVVGEPLPSRPIDDPNIFFSFAHKPVTYRFTSGRNKGKIQTLLPTKVERPGGKFVWRVQLAPSLIGFLRQMPNGDIVMPAVEDTGAEALVVSTPDNLFISAGMKPGETHRFVQEVSVRYLDNIDDERWSGKLQTDFTYVGTYRTKVPAGSFDAVLLRTTVDGRVGPAHTHATSYSLFAPGEGLVAMILQQRVTAFWIYNVNGVGGKVLTSTPKATN